MLTDAEKQEVISIAKEIRRRSGNNSFKFRVITYLRIEYFLHSGGAYGKGITYPSEKVDKLVDCNTMFFAGPACILGENKEIICELW